MNLIPWPRQLVLAFFFFVISACSNRAVMLVHPHSGSTTKCTAAGVGIGAGWAEGFIGECIKQHESKGYVLLDKLTPEQRADLQKRGVLPGD